MPRKGENIYKRKDGRWEGRYIKSRTSTGKIIYGSVYARTYRDTKHKLKTKSSIPPVQEEKIIGDEQSMLFSAIAADWFEGIKIHTKESTQNKYYNLMSHHILPKYGNQTLDRITYESLEDHCSVLLLSGGKNGTGLSPKTVSDVLSILRSILKHAVRKGYVVPCDGSAVSVKQTRKPMRIFSRFEQDKILQFILKEPDPCHIGILICMFTGLRVGEICALRWDDLSFTEQTLYVHQTMQRIQNRSSMGPKTKVVITSPKSSCSIRTIPIPDTLMRVLVSYQKNPHGFVLTNEEDRFVEPRTMQNKFKKLLKSCHVPEANFHTLRHTFATRCIEYGFDVKSLSEILGHATVHITMNRYVHPTLDLKKENMQKLAPLLVVK